MFFNSRRWVSLVRGCVGQAVRGRRSRRNGTAWRLEPLELRIVPAIITVTSAADNLTVNGQVTLREAIQAANTDLSVDGSTAGSGADTIEFAPALTRSTITLGGTQLRIASNLTINGLGASQLTISGGNASRIFQISGDTTVVISGLALTNGSLFGASVQGGAIYNESNLTLINCSISNSASSGVSSGAGGVYNHFFSTLTINNSTITRNSATYGAGIFNNGNLMINNSTISGNAAVDTGGGIQINNGTVTIDHVTISGNSADDGGGINYSLGELMMSNSLFTGNTARRFGGALFNQSHLTVNNSTISGNSAAVDGGGIYQRFGLLTINNSTISGNTADGNGGGLLNRSNPTINNSTISGNSAAVDGGGIYQEFGLLTINNSTISGNTADRNGGGIFIDFFETIRLRSTIVANNDAVTLGDDINGSILSEFSLIERRAGFTVVDTMPGSNRYGLDPRLGPLADNGGPTETHALLPGSPAINRGFNYATPRLSGDQRGLGFVRAVERTDIGAFEFQKKGSYLVPDLSDPARRQVIVVGSTANDTITVAMAAPNLNVTLNGRLQRFVAANIAGIVVQGDDGNDTITLTSLPIGVGGIVYGGRGDDVLTGSAGNDLLLGGEGDDRLLGQAGADVLIGGDGTDGLTGGNGDDLLIGGITLYDNSTTALHAIRSEWASASAYALRVQNLTRGLNGAPPLDTTTVFDGYYDELTADTTAGTGGLELLFCDESDFLTGVNAATEQAVLVQ